MSQLDAAQTVAAQTLGVEIETTDLFEKALYTPGTAFNVVVDVEGYLNKAIPTTFGYMPDMGFAAQTLPDDPDQEVSEDPESLLLRFSSRPVEWKPDDEIDPNGFAEVRIATRSNVESRVNLAPGSTSGGVTNVGSLILNDRDHYFGPYILKYNFSGRLARILVGLADHPRKDYRELISTYVDTIQRSIKGQLTINLQDQRFRLGSPFQTRVFTATGVLGGTPDMVGRKMPRLIGFRKNVPGILINPNLGTKLVNDGPINSVTNCYFGGDAADYYGDYPTTVALEDAYNDIPQGYYATCLNEGSILPRPAGGFTGPITFGVQGDSVYGYSDKPGEMIVKELLRAGVGSYEINTPVFNSLSGSAGYYYDGSNDVSFRDVIEALALSGGARLASDLLFTAISLTPPENQLPDDTFIAEEVRDLEYKGTISLPVLKFTINYSYNDYVLNADDIILPEENAEFKLELQKPYLSLGTENKFTRYVYSTYIKEIVKDTLLNDDLSASNLQVQYSNFWGQERHLWACKLPARALFRSVGAKLMLYSTNVKAFTEGRMCLLVSNNRQLETFDSIVYVVT